MKNGEIHFIIDIPSTYESLADEILICSTAVAQKNFPRDQPRRRRSLSERHALAEDAGVQGKERSGVSRLRYSQHV